MSKMLRRTARAVAVLAALALGGAAIAAADSSTTPSTSSNTTSTQTSSTPPVGAYGDGPAGDPGGGANFPAPGSAAHEGHEKAVTGEDAEKAKAAALASVPGTAGEVTTDYPGTGYEVTVTKSDGSNVSVHLDSSFKVKTMPAGGPGRGGPGRGGPIGTGAMPPGGKAPSGHAPSGQTPPAA
ncbi:MAG TPA: hypothetical protein VKG82_07635 [Solirubrobacteraceae bacterium]|nr:hypothetical protein [Solirubrobacteraceae bacterium]